MGTSLLINVTALPGIDAKLEIAAPMAFAVDAYARLTATDKQRMSDFRLIAGRLWALYHYPDASRVVPKSAGQVRRLFPAGRRLLMLTDTGNLVVFEVTGDFRSPQARLYLVVLPAPLRGELLAQDLVSVYLSAGLQRVVLALNGHPFGSKVWSFDGRDGSDAHHRLFYHRLTNDQPILKIHGLEGWQERVRFEFVPWLGQPAPIELSLPELETK